MQYSLISSAKYLATVSALVLMFGASAPLVHAQEAAPVVAAPVAAETAAPVAAPEPAPAAAPAPATTSAETTQAETPSTVPASDSSATPARPLVVEAPANLLPLAEFTPYLEQHTAVVPSGDKDIQMTYFWLPPATAPAEGQKVPLLVFLHGATGKAPGAFYTLKESFRKNYPAYILIPALPDGKRWLDPGKMKPDVHALPQTVELIKQLETKFPIDTKRVYVVGCSKGGDGAYGAANAYSDVFAAAVPISAMWSPREVQGMVKVPIAAFHGMQDKIADPMVSKGIVAEVKAIGGTAYFTPYDNMGHECDNDLLYNDLLWKWLFEQKKTP